MFFLRVAIVEQLRSGEEEKLISPDSFWFIVLE